MGVRAWVVTFGPEELSVEYVLNLEFVVSNNGAEYEAVIAGFDLVEAVEANVIALFSDSQLVIRQLNGSFESNELIMGKYLEKVKTQAKKFKKVKVIQIPCE